MRLTYLSDSSFPSRTANSIQVLKMVNAFAANSYSVELISPNYENKSNNISCLAEFYGFSIKANWKTLPIFKIKGSKIWYGFYVAIYLIKRSPEIIYGRCLQSIFFSSLIYRKRCFYELHKLPTNAGFISSFMFKFLLRRSKIVAISEQLRRDLILNYSIEPSNTFVAHDGADEPHKNVDLIPLNKDNFNVGYIGHLYSGKGMEIIFEIAKRCKWAVFHIVGGTESDLQYWKKQTEGLNNMIFYGFVSHRLTYSYQCSFDVLLAPYKKHVSTSRGGNIANWMSPLKIFEYMSTGKPILASNLPVLTEVLKDNYNSLLCDPENIATWIEALGKLRDNQLLKDKLGENAKNDFLASYTWKKRASRITSWVFEK